MWQNETECDKILSRLQQRKSDTGVVVVEVDGLWGYVLVHLSFGFHKPFSSESARTLLRFNVSNASMGSSHMQKAFIEV